MKPRTTVILLLLLAVVGGAWWLTRGLGDAPSQDPDDGPAEPTALFPEGTLDLTKVDRFEIARVDGTVAEFVRQRGRWRMTAPVSFDADATTVNQLLQSVALLTDHGPADAETAADPLATLSLSGDGETRVVYFDDTVGGGLGRVRIDNGAPRLVDDILHDFLTRYDPVDLLSKQLATPNAYNTGAFSITTRASVTRLVNIDGRWWIDGDNTQPALSEPVEGCVDIAGYLNIPNATKIERFVPLAQEPTDPDAYGLGPDGLRVRLDYSYRGSGGADRAATLYIGAPTSPEATSYYAVFSEGGTGGSPVFVLPAEFSVVMAKQADDFRDPRVFTVPPEQAERVELLDVWSLPLADERGSLIDPRRPRPGDYVQVREALSALLTLRSNAYVSYRDTAPRWEEAARLRVVSSRGETELVTFYRPILPEDTSGQEPGADRYLAVRGHESVGMRVDPALVAALLALGELDLPFEPAVNESR